MRPWVARLSLLVGLALSPSLAGADDARSAAAQSFKAGEQAYKNGDYKLAAEAFEQAYRTLPHPFALWNAARAWRLAGDEGRAATLYARYLREAPADATDRAEASKALGELSPRLGRLTIVATGVDAITLDGKPSDDAIVYVGPGLHVVAGTAGEQTVHKEQIVDAGGDVTVTLTPAVPPPPSPPPSSTPASASAPPPASTSTSTLPATTTLASTSTSTSPRRSGWSPVVVVVGASVTGALGVLTLLSGADVLSQKSSYDSSGSRSDYDSGVTKEHRTNFLLGSTILLGALTGVAALWLVDWSGGKSDVKVGVGPSGIVARGRF